MRVELVRRGVCRWVLLIDRYAIKVPRCDSLWGFSRGLQANLSEREWSGMAGVAPVVWSLFGLVNVYPRCEPLLPADAPLDEDWDAYDEVAPGFYATDKKPENLGLLKGRVVWIDYDTSFNGCPHERFNNLGDEDETEEARR